MPFVKIQTNIDIEPESGKQLLASASKQLAENLGKPERYVMVDLVTNKNMLFAGSEAPLAYVEIKSIGLSDTQTQHLSEQVCGELNARLGILPERIYIEFVDVPRKFWGWNASTF